MQSIKNEVTRLVNRKMFKIHNSKNCYFICIYMQVTTKIIPSQTFTPSIFFVIQHVFKWLLGKREAVLLCYHLR